jgi:hypothetical protein
VNSTEDRRISTGLQARAGSTELQEKVERLLENERCEILKIAEEAPQQSELEDR